MSLFQLNFEQSRGEFRKQAETAGPALQETLGLQAKGYGQVELSIDIAVYGSLQATHILFHVCGTHGVEGYPGSAIQRMLLGQLPGLSEQVCLVFVHALNPYGMEMLRRVNENNVDLNRNFLADNEKYEGAPELYSQLDPVLNPRDSFDLSLLQQMAQKYSEDELKVAILSGQYEFPSGLFYGGQRLEEGPKRFLEWIRIHFPKAARVVGIEIHSGLGDYGEQMLLSMCSEAGLKKRRDFERAVKHSLILEKRESGGYPVRGGLAEAMAREYSGAETIWMVQEFGTFPPLQMLAAFCEENFYFHQGVGPEHESRIKLLQSFSPPDPAWEKQVLDQGAALFHSSLAYLSGP